MLHLHPEPLAGSVRAGPRLRDHAIEASALELLEPSAGGIGVARVGGHEDGGRGALEERLEPLAPLTQWPGTEIHVARGQDVEGDVPGRRCLAEHSHARLGRVDPLL